MDFLSRRDDGSIVRFQASAKMNAVDESETLRQRKRAFYRLMALEAVGIAAGAAIVGVVLGLSEDSAAWGFAGAFIFLGFAMIASLAVLAFRGQLRNTGRLYGKAVRRSFSGRGGPESR